MYSMSSFARLGMLSSLTRVPVSQAASSFIISRNERNMARGLYPAVALSLVGHDAPGLHLPHGYALMNGGVPLHALPFV